MSRTVRFTNLSSGSSSSRPSRAPLFATSPVKTGPELLERRVQEACLREVVDLPRTIEVVRDPESRPLLDALEGLERLGDVGGDIQRLCFAFGVDAVAGVELHEVELGLGRRAHQFVEMVEDFGHEVPRRSGVETKAVVLPRSGAATELLVAFEQHDVVSFTGQQRG